jgi:hypothetical protein
MEKLTPYSATINVMFFNQDGKGKIFWRGKTEWNVFLLDVLNMYRCKV